MSQGLNIKLTLEVYKKKLKMRFPDLRLYEVKFSIFNNPFHMRA